MCQDQSHTAEGQELVGHNLEMMLMPGAAAGVGPETLIVGPVLKRSARAVAAAWGGAQLAPGMDEITAAVGPAGRPTPQVSSPDNYNSCVQTD